MSWLCTISGGVLMIYAFVETVNSHGLTMHPIALLAAALIFIGIVFDELETR